MRIVTCVRNNEFTRSASRPIAPLWSMTLAATVAAPFLLAVLTGPAAAQDQATIKDRHIGASRTRAASTPRSEGDQAVIDGWPLYRTEKGQAAFNDTMATLKATDAAAPAATVFKSCPELQCNLTLPAIGSDGWIPAGRIWVSSENYVLIVHSPRLRQGQSYRRRPFKSMRVFVYHEFHNGSRNTDTPDTISSHSGSVYVPFYMSKQGTDAQGRHFVAIVQVAPYDVVSIHATNHGSAGPGIEVAKNVNDSLEPLQAQAGVVIGTIIKAAAPHVRVVNHRGTEGQPMLSAYERQVSAARARPGSASVTLPFAPAPAQRVAAVTASLDDLILARGASPRIPVAERAITGPQLVRTTTLATREPVLIEPPKRATPPECMLDRAVPCRMQTKLER